MTSPDMGGLADPRWDGSPDEPGAGGRHMGARQLVIWNEGVSRGLVGKGAMITVRAFFSLASVALMLAAIGISPAMAAGTTSAGPATTAGADLLRLRVAIDERCFQGRGIVGAIHTVSLRAADGQLRARQIVRPDAQGDFSACFPEGFTVNPTDVTTLRAAGLRARARIPDLRPFISRSAETVRGTGRPGDVLQICVQDKPRADGRHFLLL